MSGPLALCLYEAMGWSTTQGCSPPAMTLVSGFTWFGGSVSSGTTGSSVGAFATDDPTGRSYKLVTGLDAGPDFPCMRDTVPLNTALRTPSSSGFIGGTSGVINRGPGVWQVCFREETGTANPLRVTFPRNFTVA